MPKITCKTRADNDSKKKLAEAEAEQKERKKKRKFFSCYALCVSLWSLRLQLMCWSIRVAINQFSSWINCVKPTRKKLLLNKSKQKKKVKMIKKMQIMNKKKSYGWCLSTAIIHV